MLKKYPRFERGEVEKIYKKLSKSEQKLIKDYLNYRQVNGLGNTSDLRRYLIQVRHIINQNFKKFKDFNEHIKLCLIIKESWLSNEVKKNLKINLNNFFGEFLFPDSWNKKFSRIYSNKNQKKEKGEGSDNKTSNSDLPTDKELEKMIKSELSLFWKTFLLVLIAAGLRTIEARKIIVKKITFNPDGTATIEVYMTKTGGTKFVFMDTQTTDFIKKLIEEQKNTNSLGKYLFHSPTDKDKPIHKNSVNKWFKELSIRATGRHFKPGFLRKKKATQLYNLAKNNVIAENTALKLMGHSRSMMKTYDKTPPEKEIKILKQQAFKTEISEGKKHELEEKIEKLKKDIKDLQKFKRLVNDILKDVEKEGKVIIRKL